MRDHENWAWVDVETGGTNPQTSPLLEIAIVITDDQLNILDKVGFHAIVRHGDPEIAEWKAMVDPHVLKMHEKTGLWDKLNSREAKPLAQIDGEAMAYLSIFGKPGTMPVAGNSVRLDMNFMDRYLPLTAKYLDYHMRDVSTIAGIAHDWYNVPRLEKHSDHTAMTDIRESIRELKHYREQVFLPLSDFSSAPSFTCPQCQSVSFNPNDIIEGYCGRCHAWTDPSTTEIERK